MTKWLARPGLIALLCAGFLVYHLVIRGLGFHLWGLNRDLGKIAQGNSSLQAEISKLKTQLQKARQPAFVEHEAMNRLEMVTDRDLIFVFPDTSK